MSNSLNCENTERFTEPVAEYMAVLHDIWQQGRAHYKRQLQYFIRIGNTVIFYPSYPRRALLRHPASLHHSDQLVGRPDLIGRYNVTNRGEKEGGTVCLQCGAFSMHIMTFVNVWGEVYVIFHWPIISYPQYIKNLEEPQHVKDKKNPKVNVSDLRWRGSKSQHDPMKDTNRLWNTLGNQCK